MVHKETDHKISLLLSKREWRFPCRGKRGREGFIVENRRDGTRTEYTWGVNGARTRGVLLKEKSPRRIFTSGSVGAVGLDLVT